MARRISMTPPLTVLFVEDDLSDVELERAALRHEFRVEATVVDTPVGLQAELKSGRHQIVLCDYTMPQFSGMEALSLWHSCGAPVPFIYVSGTLSEELAVESIKAGATDYVLKGHLTRLPMAVDRALREFAAARALREIEAERARVVAAVEQTEEAVLITDPDGVIVYVNPAFSLVTGYSPDEALGRNVRILRSQQNAPNLYADLWRNVRAGKVWRGQLVNQRRDGSSYDAELTITPVFDGAGNLASYSAILRDVSQRVAAERSLRALNAKLAETDRHKDEFLAAFSHELRTPLHVILGYSDMLVSDEHLSDEERGFLDVIAGSARHLTTLINHTLDLARLRIDALKPHFERADVCDLVREVVQTFAPMAESKGLALHCSLPATPITVVTDPLRLREVLSNLMDNAVKFTERGEVGVDLRTEDAHLSIEVRDTGIGVAPENVPKMFEDFRQLDSSSTRRYGGCGLGLALSKRLLDLLGGSVEVHSQLGRGTSVRVRLPRKDRSTSKPAP
jgi:PAS domain S-box-containing protein